ncbi:hypothetical protein SZN_08234 [Streptomyces zinciresistens K42]|uniref:Secreted protein n=1 Tax=Streptomyces zinciresistens K42 TaxID=700597 RepID=G2G833_9ACTN|nr:hypothetical protein [Streptomyces zinciresistens]EGX60321.1 hypothetical protein SZN_08234 [Streptomyces zinciresistens K42]
MHKLRKAAVMVAALGSVGILTAGTATAGEGDYGQTGSSLSVLQSSNCRSHDANVDILGQVGIANGLGGNLLNGEGNPGSQETGLGSSMGCSNSAFGK